MYCLQAVIATEYVLRESAGSTAEACIVPLGRHLWHADESNCQELWVGGLRGVSVG